MIKTHLKENFLEYCKKNKLEQNVNQLKIIDLLSKFIKPKKNFLNFLSKNNSNMCFYLYGAVGVGKTMLLNFFFQFTKIPKQRLHFNEFMINFHNYRHKNKKKSILMFVKNLKKRVKLIYLDEFQVTNIVDAMILSKLFETIFKENIKVLITSNIQIENLYKDGLQREQFLPFISLLKKNSLQRELIIDEDYRKKGPGKLQKAFYPNNEKTSFRINKIFREITKNKKLTKKILLIKGRKFTISNFYEGIAKFDFQELCDVNIGAEDYLEIADICKLIVIQNIPKFSDLNINQQQRFITLIDILYEKKIYLIISLETNLENIGSSNQLEKSFKRTLSRLFELTSSGNEIF